MNLSEGETIMLGTHLMSNLNGDPLYRETLHQEMSVGFSDTRMNRLVLENNDSSLYVTQYPGYPSRVFEDREFAIHLEGLLYNVDETTLPKELTRLAKIVFTPNAQMQEKLARWMLNTDGDFLIVIRNKKSGAIAAINDILGRLPTYYSICHGSLILTRDFRLASRLSGKDKLDRMAVAQYLLLGFCPGERTFFQDIRLLEPASMIINQPQESSWHVTRIHNLNFEEQKHAGKDREQNARQLATRFREACRNRSRWGGKPFLSLSGGMDSRAVAAGLWKEGIPFTTGSYLDERQTHRIDFRSAKEIAATLGVEWYGIHLPAPRGNDLVRLLDLKQGFNNLRMSFILSFFLKLKERFDENILFLTGDGGGNALKDPAPYRHTPTLDSLADYVIERHQTFSLQDVAVLTGLSAHDLRANITELLASYPETSPTAKYKHFFCFEMAVKIYHQGEDRNRQYFWSATPFFATDFFTYAMNCPDKSKKGYLLYRDFLSELNPALCNIPDTNWKAPIGSTRFKVLYHIKNQTRAWPAAIRRLRRLTGHYDTLDDDSNILGCLREQTERSADLGDVFDIGSLRNLLRDTKTCDRLQLWTLLTLTSAIDNWTNPRPVLTDYLDKEFK
ncbi:MAG: hypothetical protein AB2L21_00180 [Anaerolineaceae bacterium]